MKSNPQPRTDKELAETLEFNRRQTEGAYRRQREVRACERCGFKRKVSVSYERNRDIWWSKLCGACSLLTRANKLKRQAARFEAKATELLIKRRTRQKP